jgi:hypothetical protein
MARLFNGHVYGICESTACAIGFGGTSYWLRCANAAKLFAGRLHFFSRWCWKYARGVQDHRQDHQEACDAGGSQDWLRPHVSAHEVAAETGYQGSGAQREPVHGVC